MQGLHPFQIGFRIYFAGFKFFDQAVERFFGVKVREVRTLNVKGKPKRLGRHMGRRKDWKKAIITVQSGDKIDIFDVV